MSKIEVKLYWDGEFLVDGKPCGKLYDNGEIYIDGKSSGKIYHDGDIYWGNQAIGKVYPNGELWIGNQFAASNVPLLELIDNLSSGMSNSNRCEYIYLDADAISEISSTPRSQSMGSHGFSSGSGGGSAVGCSGPFFVGILLLICLFVACFQFWWSEVPVMFTRSMNTPWVGTLATASLYIWLAVLLYVHWDFGTRKNKAAFWQGLLMQGGSVVVHVLVFYALDLIITAISYGLSPFEALAGLGTVTGFKGLSGILGMVLTVALCGLAPTLVGTVINMIYLKFKGPRDNAPESRLISAVKSVPGRVKDGLNSLRGKSKANSSFKNNTKSGQQKAAASNEPVTIVDQLKNSGFKFSPNRRVESDPVTTGTKDGKNMRVVNCSCGAKFRYPTDKGSIVITCPKCKKAYRYFPNK